MLKHRPKMIAINGSLRADKGFTDIILRRFVEGAQSVNAQCDLIYLSRKKIAHCLACDTCLFKTPGVCKFNDDMGLIISKMEEADILVFAIPVYFDAMSSHMKKVIERLRPTLGAHIEFRNGRTYHLRTNRKKQKFVTIFTAGNSERETFISISRNFKRIIDNMGGHLIGEFCFPASHLIATQPERLSHQLEAVFLAGKEFAFEGEISQELLEKANKNYIDNPEAVAEELTRMILQIRENYNTGQIKE